MNRSASSRYASSSRSVRADGGTAAYDSGVERLSVRTDRKTQLVEITRLVEEVVAGVEGSAVLVYVPHTTAGVTINENADPAVARDLETALARLVADDAGWQHVEGGEQNAASHIRTTLV